MAFEYTSTGVGRKNPVRYRMVLDSSDEQRYLRHSGGVSASLPGLVKRLGGSESAAYAAYWAAQEFLVNSGKHGNKYASDSRVEITMFAKDGVFTLKVRDQGEGVDVSDVKTPIEAMVEDDGGFIDAMLDHGRGLFGVQQQPLVERVYNGQSLNEVCVDISLEERYVN